MSRLGTHGPHQHVTLLWTLFLPDVAIVMLSQHLQRSSALELLSESTAGTGYLLRQGIAAIDAFCSNLRRVCNGERVLAPSPSHSCSPGSGPNATRCAD